MANTVVYQQADPTHPFVGLYNEVCHSPEHWCACHHVWLSEDDAQKRNCRHKPSSDGKGCRCTAFLEGQYDRGIESMIRKTRTLKRSRNKGSHY